MFKCDMINANRSRDMTNLESWLRRHNMSTVEFATLIKCSRAVIWKVKRGMTIDPSIANAIIEFTKGEVVPMQNPRGRRAL